MFWGLVMEPSKLYSQIVERPFHISQAALDSSTGDNDLCQVMVSVDGKKFLICTLQKRLSVQVPLDLYFKAGECIAFVTNGKCNIHLTGYLDPEFEEEEEEEDDDEEEEENEEDISSKKRKALSDVSRKPKKAKNSAVEFTSTLKQLLDSEDMDSDEDDESFIANTSAEADDTSLANTTTEADDSGEADSDDENSADDDSDEDSEVSVANGFCSTLDTKGDAEVDMTKLTKSQRKRLKKKLSKVTEAKPKVNGVCESSEIKKTKESKELKKKEVKIAEKKLEKKEPQKENKTITGGVQIEDLKVGNGQLAKPGKVVMVYYEGRLKKNNKTFDKCSTGPGFKFRLGAKEVISGWDIGVAGMRSGGVRKIVCPPSSAYGAKGSPPVIPPNSTLVFEVELKNVK